MKVSILIPARNEEKVLPRLFGSLEKLQFPTDQFEILLINDHSTDNTLLLLEGFAKKYAHVRVFSVREEFPTLKGKTRALAILAEKAQGQIWLLTDADMALPPTWIPAMLKAFDDGRKIKHQHIGVVVGLSGLKPINFTMAMQGIEWLMVLTLFKKLDKKNIPSTGMGNNMAITPAAYKAIGGYEALGFNIVEDYAIYMAIIKAGFGFYHSYSPEVLAWTLPPANFFEQRKRWFQGAVQAKPIVLVCGLLRILSLPIYVVLGYYLPVMFIIILCLEVYINIKMINEFEQKLKLRGYLKWTPLYLVYAPVSGFLQFINYILPGKIVWKERKF